MAGINSFTVFQFNCEHDTVLFFKLSSFSELYNDFIQ